MLNLKFIKTVIGNEFMENLCKTAFLLVEYISLQQYLEPYLEHFIPGWARAQKLIYLKNTFV